MARQHMQVQVRNRLPASRLVGLQDGQAGRREGSLYRARDAMRRRHQRHGRGFIGVQQGFEGLDRCHDHMAGIDLAGIHESEHASVFVDFRARQFSAVQAGENSVSHHGLSVGNEYTGW